MLLFLVLRLLSNISPYDLQRRNHTTTIILAWEQDSLVVVNNRCRQFFVVFLFFCSEICQVNNYKRQALYLLIVKSGTL